MITIKTGEILTAYCNRKGVLKSRLSQKTGIEYQSLLKHLRSNTLRVDLLLKISEGLEHNFFMDIAAQLPKSYSSDISLNESLINENETLKEKIKLLETEKNILLQVTGVKG
ncbi:hypothetical protein [Flavobacterium sp. 5]|uniref:hypothetical protein n=1 Tax=Flavobacterium sp. 5 TaxID=2035199 RepID=UPI000C2C77D9|nr:hypothetical protein [Flavobacterium sp. 5]PKB15288.1 hypothetical protein CLU82_0354 [Flavobacterium sp. 5]